MKKKQSFHLITVIVILFTVRGLHSQESDITLGEEDLWNTVQITNLSLIDGKRGFLDITNSHSEYIPDKHSDMILHLNKPELYDATGNYTFLNQVSYMKSVESMGGGAAYFDGSEPLLIEPGINALFSPSTLWGDFSLEFRLLPATLKEGSTIMLWKGLQKKENLLVAQEIRCTVSNRQLVWDFENFFMSPDNSLRRISLTGDKLIPGSWSHHMVSFDSETGLLEYKINNIPADNIYTSKNERESLEFNIPLIGNQQSFPIELGENFSGLIDEFRISKDVISDPALYRFSTTGYLESEILDLHAPDSFLKSIEAESSKPGNTSIRYQYAISNDKYELLGPDIHWEDFEPFKPIGKQGRYIKIRSQLFSEAATENAPTLSNIKVKYKEANAPYPPLNVSVEKTENDVKVSWDKSIDPEIKGYLIYYGEEPGKYFSIDSPIDARLENSIILKGLSENKHYYIAVTSYKSLQPRLESLFSQEISIIP